MSKIPRDVPGKVLIRFLRHVGFIVENQEGSHVKLALDDCTIVVPAHVALKTGTLSAILAAVAACLKVTKAEIVRRFREWS